MRYYLIEQEKKDMTLPSFKGWFKRNSMNPKSSTGGSNRELYIVEAKNGVSYPDMMFHPFVLLSKELSKCLMLYEPKTMMKSVVLLDQKRKDVHEYYKPTIANVDCLAAGSEYCFGHVELSKIVLNGKKIQNKVLFRIKGPEKDYYVIRLDALESFIRRGMTGIKIREISVSYDE